jgi:uncharacterized protein YkwD
MNPADIILIICILAFTFIGYQSGFINSFLSIIKWSAAVLTAVVLYKPLSGLLDDYFIIQQQWQWVISFALVFASAMFLMSLLVTVIKKWAGPELRNAYVNKITGIIPGFVAGVFVAIVLAKLFTASIWFDTADKQNKTFLLSAMITSTAGADKIFNNIFNEAAQQVAAAKEAQFGTSDLFKSSVFTPMPGLETQLLYLVNNERLQRGLPVLVPDTALQQAARLHAADMFTRGYFAHNNPDGSTPFDRMRKLGITYRSAGENLAHSYDLDAAHTGLMNSPGHRENILNTRFGRIGIAVLQSDTKGLMVVQEFRN